MPDYLPQNIETAEQRYFSEDLVDAPVAEWAVLKHAPDVKVPTKAAKSPVLVAYVNHGRWVADCPSCRSAQVVTPNDPRFLCVCGNADTGGKWLPISFPLPADMNEIDSLLGKRPDTNRNWTPDEPVGNLELENRVRGLS
jgi:hypothetical protein